MKRLFIFLPGAIILTFFSCNKIDSLNNDEEQSFFTAAKKFFYQQLALSNTTKSTVQSNSEVPVNPRKRLSKRPDWATARIVKNVNGKIVVVPIRYQNPFLIRSNFSGGKSYNINDLTKLLIHQDARGMFYAELVTYIPDSNYSNHARERFNGIVVVEDWEGKALKRYTFGKNKTVKRFDLSKIDESKSFTTSKISRIQSEHQAASRMSSITVCYYIEGYNSGPLDPEGYYWTEFIGCTTYFIQDVTNDGWGDGGGGGSYYGDFIGGGGGGGGIPTANTFTIPSGDNVIGNISDYLKCFDNIPGNDHTYKVSICVSQPNPGTREAWGLSGSGSSGSTVFVGHAFLVLTEVTPNKTITRNVGFYPSGEVWPNSPSSQGQLNNDANQDYNISLTITMTSSQFTQILNYISLGNNSGFTYNLNTNNCTTFALDALRAGGINLPRTNGTWLNGGGLNPGDLGEDIRNMSLSSNMTRSTVYNYHPNVGSCY